MVDFSTCWAVEIQVTINTVATDTTAIADIIIIYCCMIAILGFLIILVSIGILLGGMVIIGLVIKISSKRKNLPFENLYVVHKIILILLSNIKFTFDFVYQLNVFRRISLNLS